MSDTTTTELERLRGDLAVLERYKKEREADFYGDVVIEIRERIARIAAERADPWREHKAIVGTWRLTNHGSATHYKMVDFFDHMTAENQRLKNENSEVRHALGGMLSVMGPPYTTKEALIAKENAERVLGIVGEPIDVSFEESSNDPYSDLREALNDWHGLLDNGKTIGEKACKAAAQLEALIETNERLTKRVAELEAEPEFTPAVLKRADEILVGDVILAGGRIQTVTNIDSTHQIRRIIKCDGWMAWFYNGELVAVLPQPLVEAKTLADMQPPFEGPIVGLEPILDPARVLATASEILMTRSTSKAWRDRFGQIVSDLGCVMGSANAKPYRVKGVENGS